MTVFQKIKQKNKDQKGFTLGELLIVVAIIGVLVAISIPIFTTQLKKAQRAVSEANLRSIYSELVADYIDDGHYSITLGGYITDGLSPTEDKATIIVQHTDTGYEESFIIYNVNYHGFPLDGQFKDGVEPSFYVVFNDDLDPVKISYPGTSDNNTGDDGEDDEDDDEDDEEDDE